MVLPARLLPRRLRPASILLALALAACTRNAPPAPVNFGAAPSARAAALAPAQSAVPHPDSITVLPGETLYAVARRYNVPLRSLIEANGLQPPFQLVAGRRLALPQVWQYTVQPGDTLNSVARRYGLDASTLARTNELAPPYTVRTGQALILPAPVQTASAAPPPAPVVAPGAPAPIAATPLPGPITATPLAPPPNAGALPPAVVPAPVVSPQPQTLALPGRPAEPPAGGLVVLPPAVKPSQPPAAEPPVAAPARPPEPPAVALARPPEPVAPEPAPEPSDHGHGFTWPVRGPILVGYGPGANGTQNDGINIAAPRGTPIAASDDGVVKYVGNELRGYGNLILVKHANGWMSAYAHCDAILVKRNDQVRRGQTIARVGQTGAVTEPQLHFELRRGAHALDPTSYLPQRAAAASG